MTQEERDLLLKDLCARLAYGIFVKENRESLDNSPTIYTFHYHPCIDNCKPYLRPISSMTEEEKNELRNILWFGYPSDDNDKYSHRGIEVKQCLYDDEKNSTYDFDDFRVLENFLLKNHFDYRGLIPMGLAIKAPKDMYNSKP